MKLLAITILFGSLVSCATFQSTAGYEDRTNRYQTGDKAKVIFSETLDLSKRRDILLVPIHRDSPRFFVNLVRKKQFFQNVFTLDQLEKKAISEQPLTSFTPVSDRVGIHNLALNYKPFLWLESDFLQEGNSVTMIITLTDPTDMKEYFKAEIKIDHLWNGINDQNSWYPLINAFFDYLDKNE
jgi:hypothetical protein